MACQGFPFIPLLYSVAFLGPSLLTQARLVLDPPSRLTADFRFSLVDLGLPASSLANTSPSLLLDCPEPNQNPISTPVDILPLPFLHPTSPRLDTCPSNRRTALQTRNPTSKDSQVLTSIHLSRKTELFW